MKKLISLLLLLTLSLTLSACSPTTDDNAVDCDLYPTHVDCLVDPDPDVNCDTDPDNEVCSNEEQELNCDTDPDNELCPLEDSNDFLDIYYINDFHGAILPDSDQLGMAYIANFLVTKKEANPDNVIILAGGDILQGTALSNYYNGYSTISMMNEMYFDAYTLGNHEFDWGLNTVTAYFDDNSENGEANFPLLGANVFYEGTTNIPEGIDPYVIIERAGLKIG